MNRNDTCKIDESSLMDEFNDLVKSFDFGIYRPFYHGTTMEAACNIMEKGLLRRADNPDGTGALKWGEEGVSEEDLVYFTTCMERTSVGVQACKRMFRSSEQTVESDCAFIELVNYGRYEKHFTIDEDSKSVPPKIKKFFSDEPFLFGSSVVPILRKMYRPFAVFYERGFLVGGSTLVAEMVDATPSALFSIADWGTFAVRKSIDPSDLRIVSHAGYKQRVNCRDMHGYDDLDENLYYFLARNRGKEQVESFKKQIREKM